MTSLMNSKPIFILQENKKKKKNIFIFVYFVLDIRIQLPPKISQQVFDWMFSFSFEKIIRKNKINN